MYKFWFIAIWFNALLGFSQKTHQDSLPYLPFIKTYETNIQSNANKVKTQKAIASLIQLSTQRKEDFFLADAYNKNAVAFYYDNQYDSALVYCKKAIAISEKANNYMVQMRAYNLHGAIDYNLGDLKSSEKNYLKKVKIAARLIATELKDSVDYYATYYNLGLVYMQQGEFLKSADVNFKAIHYFEQSKDTFDLLSSLELIGYCYQNLEDIPTAIKFYHRAIGLAKLVKDKYQLTGIYLDMHTSYSVLKKEDSALFYIEETMRLANSENDEFHYTMALNRKGDFLLEKNKPQEALTLLKQAVRMNAKSQRTFALCEDYSVLAKIYSKLHKNDSALYFAYKGYAFANEQKKTTIKNTCARVLFGVYDAKNNSDSALKYYKEYFNTNDSLKKESQLRGIAQREQLFEKNIQERQRLQEQKMAQAQMDKQKQITTIIIIASIILLIFLIISIINYLQKQKANALISEQKKILEEKNKEVQDSINYASRIQRSIMPDTNELQSTYSNCEVLYLPRDVVSGDFYWINSLPNRSDIVVYAVADCTGHGVPGAFMSLIGATLLNQTLTHPDVNTPAQALQHLNVELPKNIKNASQGETIKDGMEISMCLIDYSTLKMEFSGANNNLYIVRHNELILYKGDKQAIGQGYQATKAFTNHLIQLQKEDIIYLFTDGYPDQFGGVIGKKFKYKQLEDLIVKLSSLTIQEQKRILQKTFEDWKGELEQVDDVLLMIIKI
jgi:serine phosphatase RsbU (regulator of sigma subunit)